MEITAGDLLLIRDVLGRAWADSDGASDSWISFNLGDSD